MVCSPRRRLYVTFSLLSQLGATAILVSSILCTYLLNYIATYWSLCELVSGPGPVGQHLWDTSLVELLNMKYFIIVRLLLLDVRIRSINTSRRHTLKSLLRTLPFSSSK
jgi:hypothetical protein